MAKQNQNATTSNYTWNGASTISGHTSSSWMNFTATYHPPPFSINFNYGSKEVNVSLKNGEDIFRLAKVFMKLLDENDIEYNIRTKGKKSKK